MKKILIPLMIISIVIALYEQSQDKPNVYLLIASIIVFLVGMIKFSSKLPSKHTDDNDEVQ